MKKVFYAILFLIALYFVLALLGPKEVKVERSATINAPVALVKEKLGDFRYFHEKWSPWTEKDPAMEVSYSGIPGEPGHIYNWKGNEDVGEGKIRLERYSADSLVQVVSFADEGDALSYFLLKDENNGSRVTWGMYFKVDYLFRTPMLFMNMDEMMGADFEVGLAKLKQNVEAEHMLKEVQVEPQDLIADPSSSG